MKIGTILINNKIYDLDLMESNELKNLFVSNNNYKKDEYSKAKEACKINNQNNLDYNFQNNSAIFKSFLDNSTIYVKSEALIQRALTQKISDDVIRKKVDNKERELFDSIKRINPNITKNKKKYSDVKYAVDDIMIKYKKILLELSNFFDTKIEQLILDKLELEAHLVGSIINEEYYIEEEKKRKEDKDNDKLLLSLSSSVKNFVTKLTKRKAEKNTIDVTMISNYQDKAELEAEQKIILNNMVEKTQSSKNDYIEKIANLEKDILNIENEIKRLNTNKENCIAEAMQSTQKEISTIKNPSLINNIKYFLKSKINPTGVIYDTILNPMNELIVSYKENILKNINK